MNVVFARSDLSNRELPYPLPLTTRAFELNSFERTSGPVGPTEQNAMSNLRDVLVKWLETLTVQDPDQLAHSIEQLRPSFPGNIGVRPTFGRTDFTGHSFPSSGCSFDALRKELEQSPLFEGFLPRLESALTTWWASLSEPRKPRGFDHTEPYPRPVHWEIPLAASTRPPRVHPDLTVQIDEMDGATASPEDRFTFFRARSGSQYFGWPDLGTFWESVRKLAWRGGVDGIEIDFDSLRQGHPPISMRVRPLLRYTTTLCYYMAQASRDSAVEGKEEFGNVYAL